MKPRIVAKSTITRAPAKSVDSKPSVPYAIQNSKAYVPPVTQYSQSANTTMRPSHVVISELKSPTPIKFKRGLSADQLLKITPPYVRAKARDTETIISAYKVGTKKGFRAVSATCVSLENKIRRKHKVLIVNRVDDNPQGKLYRAPAIKVQCSCESYVMGYGYEYANWTHGAADIIYGNGQPATTTNPRSTPGLCKHLYVVLRALKQQKD